MLKISNYIELAKILAVSESKNQIISNLCNVLKEDKEFNRDVFVEVSQTPKLLKDFICPECGKNILDVGIGFLSFDKQYFEIDYDENNEEIEYEHNDEYSLGSGFTCNHCGKILDITNEKAKEILILKRRKERDAILPVTHTYESLLSEHIPPITTET